MTMTFDELKNRVLVQATQLLTRDKSKKGFLCPLCNSGSGPSGTGMKTKEGSHFTCFSCNGFKNADIIDIIGKVHGIDGYHDKVRKCGELLGIDTTGIQARTNKLQEKIFSLNESPSQATPKPKAPILDKMKAWHDNLHLGLPYLQARGISEELATRFKLGFDPQYPVRKGVTWQALIIPCTKTSCFVRNTDKKSNDRYRMNGSSSLFRGNKIPKADRPVFIVEGAFDALSILEAGGEAVALGSTSNINKLIEFLSFDTNKPKHPLLLCLDDDEAGKDALQKLEEQLQAMQIKHRVAPLPDDYKDANDFLINDRQHFTDWVQNHQLSDEDSLDSEKDDYVATHSAAGHINALLESIHASHCVGVILTGFPELDALLEGGLYPGLYIIGAISSLGKTTFFLQIADQIAQAGQDVLIFSLEMSKYELMAKSISRETFFKSKAFVPPHRYAKTTMGILCGSRYPHYSDEDMAVIEDAITSYTSYASRLFIHEGMGNMSATEIRNCVETHIKRTGNHPVVVIDYLQILAPVNEKGTDKQNVDKSVLELKRLSRDFNIPVLGISSFNRENYNTSVSMTSFKESGAIEYSSDVLLGMQFDKVDDIINSSGKDAEKHKELKVVREANYKTGREGGCYRIQVKVLKNRNGGKGDVSFDFYPMFNFFDDGQYVS